jgi:hypothetical protein
MGVNTVYDCSVQAMTDHELDERKYLVKTMWVSQVPSGTMTFLLEKE